MYLESLNRTLSDYSNALVVSNGYGSVLVRGDSIPTQDRFTSTARLGHTFSDDTGLFYYGNNIQSRYPQFSQAQVWIVNEKAEILKFIEVDTLLGYLASLISLDCNDEWCLVGGLSRFPDDAVPNADGSLTIDYRVSLLGLSKEGEVVKQYKRIPSTADGVVMSFMNRRSGQVGFVHRDAFVDGWEMRFDIYLEVDGKIEKVDSLFVDDNTDAVDMTNAVLSDDNTLSLAFFQVKQQGARSTHHVVGVDLSDYLVTSTEDIAAQDPQDLLIVPNPASDRITLGGIDQDVIEYTIVDLLGRKCVAGRYEGEIDVSGLVPGIYHLIAQYGSGVSLTARLAKQ